MTPENHQIGAGRKGWAGRVLQGRSTSMNCCLMASRVINQFLGEYVLTSSGIRRLVFDYGDQKK